MKKETFLVALEVNAVNAQNAESIVDSIMSNCEEALEVLADVNHVDMSAVSVHTVMPWKDAMKLLHHEEEK